MVRKYKSKILHIIVIILLLYIILQIIKQYNVIYCEIPEISYETAIQKIKEKIYKHLLSIINQENFKKVYGRQGVWTKSNIDINEQLLRTSLGYNSSKIILI